MNLDRIEVIAGGASALFGANAMAGVVNLLSRRPGAERSRELLFSQSARGGTDGVLWISLPPAGSWSSTYLVNVHRQGATDADDDGWLDLPEYSRASVRPHVIWDNGQGKSASGTAGVTVETREGGSEIARQQLETKTADGALFGQMPLGRFVLAGAASLYVQSRVRDFSDRREHDRRQAATIEIHLRRETPRHAWVTGIAADWFANRARNSLASGYIAPRGGIFVHDDVRVASWLWVSGSARFDYTKGASDALRIDDFFLSPRGSILARKGAWAVRVSADRSYFVPSPLTEETEAAGFERLLIDGPLEVETARNVSVDLSHRTRATTVTLGVFDTRIDDPAQIDRATYTLRTAAEPVKTRGVQILGRGRRAPFAVTGTYTYLWAREGGGLDIALTPRHDGGGSREPLPRRRGGLLHRRAAPRPQPLSIDERAVRRGRPSRRVSGRPVAAVRERRQPDGCAPDGLGSERPPVA
jgi:outer membrane receptor protein involved in Fe transport